MVRLEFLEDAVESPLNVSLMSALYTCLQVETLCESKDSASELSVPSSSACQKKMPRESNGDIQRQVDLTKLVHS